MVGYLVIDLNTGRARLGHCICLLARVSTLMFFTATSDTAVAIVILIVTVLLLPDRLFISQVLFINIGKRLATVTSSSISSAFNLNIWLNLVLLVTWVLDRSCIKSLRMTGISFKSTAGALRYGRIRRTISHFRYIIAMFYSLIINKTVFSS